MGWVAVKKAGTGTWLQVDLLSERGQVLGQRPPRKCRAIARRRYSSVRYFLTEKEEPLLKYGDGGDDGDWQQKLRGGISS